MVNNDDSLTSVSLNRVSLVRANTTRSTTSSARPYSALERRPASKGSSLPYSMKEEEAGGNEGNSGHVEDDDDHDAAAPPITNDNGGGAGDGVRLPAFILCHDDDKVDDGANGVGNIDRRRYMARCGMNDGIKRSGTSAS